MAEDPLAALERKYSGPPKGDQGDPLSALESKYSASKPYKQSGMGLTDLITGKEPEPLTIKPGMSDDEIMTSLGYDPAVIKKSRRYQIASKDGTKPVFDFWAKMADPQSKLARYGSGPIMHTLKGLSNIGTSVGQANDWLAGKIGIMSKEDKLFNELQNKLVDTVYKEAYKYNTIAGIQKNPLTKTVAGGYEILGESIPSLLVPGTGAPLLSARGIATAGVTGAAQGLLTPTEGEFTPTKKIQQMALGAGAGAAGNIVAQKVITPLVGKVANVVRGKLKPKVAEVIAETEASGVNMRPSAIKEAAKEAPEEVKQAEEAITTFSDQLKRETKQTPFAGIADIEKAAASPGPRQAKAQEILEYVKNGGQDAKDLVQTSAGLQSLREKIRLDKLRAERARLGSGLGDIETPKTVQAIDNSIERLRLDQYNDHASEIAALEAFKGRLAGGEGSNRSFQALTTTRSGLGDEIAKSYKGSAAVVGKPDAAMLQPIKKALDEDLSDAAIASGIPGLKAADKTYRAEYSKYASTYHDPTIVRAMQSPDPSSVMEALAKAGPEKAQRVFNALEPKGQKAAAESVFNEAMSEAYNPRTKDFIPGAMAAGINRRLDALGVVLTGENKKMMDGLLKTMQYLAKSSPEQASALGQRLTDSAVHAAEKSNWIASLTKAIKDNGVDILFNSKAGKRLLFAAKDMDPNSSAFDKVVAGFMNQFNKGAAAVAVTKKEDAK